MNNSNNWKTFKVGDLFTCDRTPPLVISNMEQGNTPLVTRTSYNNGVESFVDASNCSIIKGNCITIGAEGIYAFYQKEDFVTGTNIFTLRNINLNKYNGLFICTILNKEYYRYSYGRSRGLQVIKNEAIKLPVNNNGELDWQYMENYIKSLNINLPETSNHDNNNTVNISSWKKFKIQDIFDILNGKGITKDEIEENPGNLPAVQSGETNNGILGYIDLEYCKNNKYTYILDPCLTVARSGTSGFISLQPNGCVVGDSAKILRLKNNQYNSINVLIFLRTLLLQLRDKYAYGRKVTTEKYYSEIIKLPAVLDKNKQYQPDYKYMESYINILPYGDIVVDYTK